MRFFAGFVGAFTAQRFHFVRHCMAYLTKIFKLTLWLTVY